MSLRSVQSLQYVRIRVDSVLTILMSTGYEVRDLLNNKKQRARKVIRSFFSWLIITATVRILIRVSKGYSVSELNVTFVGTGNATACRSLLEALVHKADQTECHQKPCAIGPAYQPSISPSKKFYAIGSFIHALKSISSLPPNGSFVPDKVFEKAAIYCNRVRR